MKTLLLLALSLSTFAQAAAPAPPKGRRATRGEEPAELNEFQRKELNGINYQDHVVYKTVDGEALQLIILQPKEKPAGPIPYVLYTHGGGWGGGDRYVFLGHNFIGTVRTLLEHGVGFASVQYRLTRDGKSTAYDCAVDCKDAARFLVKNAAQYHVDPARLAVWGGSAGGHLSLMTALAPNDFFIGDPELSVVSPTFRGVLSYFPCTSFINPEVLKGSNFENPQRFHSMLGGELQDHLDLAKLLSPAEHLSKTSPPVYLIHGDHDQTLSIKNSLYLEQLGRERGAQVHLTTVQGGGHGFRDGVSPTLDEINAEGAAFLLKCLGL